MIVYGTAAIPGSTVTARLLAPSGPVGAGAMQLAQLTTRADARGSWQFAGSWQFVQTAGTAELLSAAQVAITFGITGSWWRISSLVNANEPQVVVDVSPSGGQGQVDTPGGPLLPILANTGVVTPLPF